MTDKSEWPQWLRDADTENAVVETREGQVVWHDGVWINGVWINGDWLGGVWLGGVFRDGVWHGGDWINGVWLSGVWLGGVWQDGVWHGGDWLGGETTPSRAMFRVTSGVYGPISVGCQCRPAAEWLAIARGEIDAPPEAPPRDSEAWKLLVAAVKAQIAWQEAMQSEHGEETPDARKRP